MKRTFKCLLAMAALSLSLTGCLPLDLATATYDEKEFTIEDYGVSFTATTEWEESEDTPFDLQISDNNSYFSVMAYNQIDLAEDQTPESIYEWHNEDIFSRRENVKIIEDYTTYTNNGKTITSTLYSAEFDEGKNYYYSFLVTFDDNEDVFAWVLVTGVPSYISNHKDDYIEIVNTMTYN